jgi:hypothetical protein
MSQIVSVSPSMPQMSSYVPPAIAPSTATLANGPGLAADLVTIGATGVAETSDYTQASIALARATPQQLALLAGNGSDHAKAILTEKATAEKLLGAEGILA